MLRGPGGHWVYDLPDIPPGPTQGDTHRSDGKLSPRRVGDSQAGKRLAKPIASRARKHCSTVAYKVPSTRSSSGSLT